MDILLNRLGETIDLLAEIETLIKKIDNKNRSRKLEITKKRLIIEINKIENTLIETKNTNKVFI
jgi:hypothetical protein